MNRSHKMIENRIERAVHDATPDVLAGVLLRVQQGEETMTQTSSGAMAPITIFPAQQTAAPKRTWIKWAGAVAAMLVLAIGVTFGINFFLPQATVSLDVNPSIELRVNRMNKVLSATALNDDAIAVLDNMNLQYVDVDVAVNALLGSMVQHGFISDLKNSVLITVDSGNEKQGQGLQQRLSQVANDSLHNLSLDGAVLSQTVSEDDRLQALASEYGITLGKAALVDLLVSQNDTLNFADIAQLPINDINLLLGSKRADLQGVDVHGQASAGAYIGQAHAKSIALQHAQVNEADAHSLEIELDYDDGRLVYEIEFRSGNIEYDYEIDATTGDIVEFDRDVKNGSPQGNAGGGQTGDTIGLDRAKTIALSDAGVKESDVKIVKQTSYTKKHVLVYDIEFLSSTTRYSYLINAQNGNIEARYLKDISNQGGSNSGSNQPPSSDSYIGADKAKEIALRDAGVSESDVYDLDVDLDRDDGRTVYEIDFKAGGYEYEYDIDATTGDIVKREIEWDD